MIDLQASEYFSSCALKLDLQLKVLTNNILVLSSMDHDQFLKNLITSNQSLSKKGFSYMAAYASCINISFNSIQLLFINASTCINLMSHLKFMMIYISLIALYTKIKVYFLKGIHVVLPENSL